MKPTLHQLNKARAKFKKTFYPILDQISERVRAASNERWDAMRADLRRKVATVATK